MDKIIKLYSYVDGINDTPFPSAENQIEIFAFDYNANRMGGAPFISAKVMYKECLDKIWTDRVYTIFNGEMFFLLNTPSSNKSNTDARYEHDAQFLSEREALNHIYFLDIVSDEGDIPSVQESCFSQGFWDNSKPWMMTSRWKMNGSQKSIPQNDKPLSNSTKVQFMGDLKEFVSRLNSTLAVSKLGYRAVIDEGVISDNKLITFEDKYILQALQEAFTAYEIPYYFVGKTIHFGYTENTVTEVFRYGHNDALLGIGKTNANFQVINRITGRGGAENIPYYYPNPSDDRAAIEAAGGKWITPSQNLMPPIYRESKGTERFYNAVNGKYPTAEGGFYEFENLYSTRKQLEGKIDFPEIKPTIVGITNAANQRIDQFIEFAYDTTDDDSFDEKTNEYNHPYFFAKMRKTDGNFGFNLFDQANEKQTMQVSMTSGVCGACTFEIGVGEETQKNIVQVDDFGNLLRDKKGNVVRSGKPQDRQNNTRDNEVWIALKKDINTYPAFAPMPNAQANLRPSVNDTFVLLGITMPQAYIDAAEKKLEESIIKYMWMNNKEKFTFSIKFSRIYFEEHPDVLYKLNENSRLLIEYDGIQHTLYVDDFSYKMDGNSPLPEIEVNLVDTLAVGKNSLQTALDSVKQDILSSIGGGDFLKQGLKYFLRKDMSDTAKGLIRFLMGAEFGNFTNGESGAKIDTLGKMILHTLESHGYRTGALGTGFILQNDPKTNKSYLEVDELFVRVKAFFSELEIKKLSYAGGNWIFSPAGMTCSKVEDYPTYYRCYFVASNKDTEIQNEFRVNDLVRSQEFNIKEGTSKNVSNRYSWRKCISVGNDYIDLSKTDCDPNVLVNNAPMAGDSMVVLGNTTDTARQNAIIISAYGKDSPSITQHSGIKTFSLEGTQKIKISPTENLFTGKFVFSTSNKSIEDELNGTNSKVDQAVKDLNENITFTNQIKKDLDEVKKQSDGAIETWFYDPVPTLQNEPAKNWTTNEEKDKHLADMYYDANGKAYRFQYKNGIYSWQIIADSDVQKALEAAKKAQDTADGKRKVFVVAPTNKSTYDEGDLWVNATYPEVGEPKKYINELLRCVHAKGEEDSFWSIDDWAKASKYTDDTKANQAIQDAANAKADAQNADTKAQQAKDRLESWADDNVISPTEKQSLKDEMARIKADKEDINSNYTKYNLGVPTDYNNAYTAYNNQLISLSSGDTEIKPIPFNFAANQQAYYTQRTLALKAIAKAATDYADKVGSNAVKDSREYTDTTFSAVDGKITAAVTESKGYTDNAVKGISIPTGNLLKNSAMSFKLLPTTSNSGIDLSIDDVDKYQGHNSLKAVFRTYSGQYDIEWATYNTPHSMSKKYTISFYAKANGSYINMYTRLSQNSEIKTTPLTSGWKRYEITYSPTTDWNVWHFWTSQPCIVNIAIPMLVEGEKPQAWVEAPQDLRLETEAKLEIMNGSIEAKAEQSVVDSLGNQVANQQQSIKANTDNISLQSKKVSTIENQVNKNTEAIVKIDPEKISLKVREDIQIGGTNHAINTSRELNYDENHKIGGMGYDTSGFKTDDEVTVSFDINWKLTKKQGNDIYRMLQFDLVYAYMNFYIFPESDNGKGWVRVKRTLKLTRQYGTGATITEDLTSKPYLRCDDSDTAYNNGGYIKVKNFKVEYGNMATAWTPSEKEKEGKNRNILFNSDFSKPSRLGYDGRGSVNVSIENKSLKAEFLVDGNVGTDIMIGMTNSPTKINTDYVFSGYVKTDKPNELVVRFGYGETENSIKTTTEYKYFEILVKSGSTAAGTLHPFIKTKGTVWFKNIKLEEGTMATAWTPAPEDYLADKQKLLDTGIDIDSHNVTVTADLFKVRSRSGQDAVKVFEDVNGIPVLQAKYVSTTTINAIKGSIGKFTIDDNGLTNTDNNPLAFINIEKIGGWYFKVNQTSTVCDIRNDDDNGLVITSVKKNYYANPKGLVINSSGGATAMEVTGRSSIKAFQDEEVKIEGASFNCRKITNGILYANDDFVEFLNPTNAAMPTGVTAGKRLFLKRMGGGVKLLGRFINASNGGWSDDFQLTGASMMFIFDGDRWVAFNCG